MAGPQATKLGPGVLTIGEETGTLQDISCKLSAAKVEWDKDKEDDLPVLCGQTIAGATAYTAKLTGTLAQDLHEQPTGFVEWTWAHKGEQHPFRFVPSTAAGKQVTGTLTVDPLTVGGDEVKKNMMSDFEYDIVGDPVIAAAPVTPADTATMGAPGAWMPTGSTPPATVADLISGVPNVVTASPTSAWDPGSHVVCGDNAHAHWSGTAWVAGDAP